MSDEESFVILGSTPTPSMENCTSLFSEPYSTINKSTINKNNSLETKIDLKEDENMEVSSFNMNENSVIENIKSIDLEDIKKSIIIDKADLNVSNDKATIQINNENEKLLSQFQLGKIEPKSSTMKSSIYTLLPSLSSGCIDTADVEKIQYIITEHHQLKENLEKTNVAMRQHFSMIQLWQNTFKSHSQTLNEKLIAQEYINEMLKKENQSLKQKIEELIENKEVYATNVDFLKQDNKDLIQKISEKESIVKNLACQLEKKEKIMSEYEFVSGTYHDAVPVKTAVDNDAVNKALLDKYIANNSVLLAENMEIKNMKQVYLDEITCLKVNVTAAEELNKKLHVDLNALKLYKLDNEKKMLLVNKSIKEKNEEIGLLKTQLEVFCHDFNIERQGREQLAGEKEQLLSDLKDLQKRNETLMKNQHRLSASTQNAAPSLSIINNYRNTASVPTPDMGQSSGVGATQICNFARNEEQVYTSHQFTCPMCSKTFRQLSTLQNHVQDCLDESTPTHPSHNYLMMNFD